MADRDLDVAEYPSPILKDLHDNAPGIATWRWIGAGLLEIEFSGGGVMQMIHSTRDGTLHVDMAGIVQEVCRDLRAGWPRCPQHTAEVLHLDPSQRPGQWRCLRDPAIVIKVGSLHDSGPTIQEQGVAPNTVRWWRDEDGYGVVATEFGDAWLTFDAIRAAGTGYRSVHDGQVLSVVEVGPARSGRLPGVTLAIP